MNVQNLGLAMLVLLAVGGPHRVVAAEECHVEGWESSCEQESPPFVEHQVRIPQWTTETRTITVVECRPEIRTRTISSMRRIPYTEAVTRSHLVMTPEPRHRTVEYTVRKPVWETVSKSYAVFVPHRVEREGTRTVCRMVPTTEERVDWEDHGHWEESDQLHSTDSPVACADCEESRYGRRGGLFARRRPTNSCADCQVACQSSLGPVWVSNMVEKRVPVKVMRPVMSEENYQYTTIEMRRETRMREVEVCRYVSETRTREVTDMVYVPKRVEKTEHVTRIRNEPITREESYTVMVPHRVTKEIQVPVCTWVEKTVSAAELAELCYSPARTGLFRRWLSR
jgi:hypothetical protein